MGTVYLAEDATLGRRVAVKVISGSVPQDDRARTRFLREARSMATVEHPNVVHVYSFGEAQGRPYLVMEYVEGETLAARIRRLGRLPIPEALDIVRQAALALEAAWEKGIVHRDIKPSNILIDKKDRVRVADFGLAKPASASGDPAVTQVGTLLGTPQYISPEQARGEDVGFGSDIYSLGIVLYEMLAGVPPFQGTTPVAVVAHHLHTPLPPLRERRPETPPGLARLVEQMTAKDSDRRPQSYAALHKAIAESAEPIPKWTSGSPYRGLAAFDFEHASIFFGRTRGVGDVVNGLRAQAASGRAFVLVLGMSGSGKSSLLRAGVLPHVIQPDVIEGIGLWRRAIFRPGDASGDLFDGLASALLRPEALPELAADGTTARALGQLLRENPKGAVPLINAGLSQAGREPRQAGAAPSATTLSGGDLSRTAGELKLGEGLGEQAALRLVRLVVLVDQMEELFTLESISPEERKGFVGALSALARSGRVWVIGALRSDFYARCEELPELMALKEGAGQYHLLPPTPAEIGQMIRQPARAAGLRFEEDPASKVGLDDVLQDTATGHAGNLPLLEFALEELYRQRTPEGLFTHAAYKEMGGIEGALAQRAAAVFASLSPEVQAALAYVLHTLVRVGSSEDETFSRKYAPLDSLASAEARAIVDSFVAARLFVADRGDDGRAVVSIAHEALLQSWPRLRDWLEENRELLRVRGRVAAAAGLWAEKGRPGDLLLAEGKPLEEALPLLRTPGIDLSEAERALIEASEARARGRRRARQLMNFNSVALLIGAAGVYVFYMWKVVPTLAATMHFWNKALPLPVRIQISAAKWTVRLSPLIVAVIVALYFYRKKITVPEFVRSGMALAVVTGVALLLSLLGFLTALFQAVEIISAMRTSP